MSSKRETVTITTLKDGIEVMRKKSKINVIRCDDCGRVIQDTDKNEIFCKLCLKAHLCKEHRREIPFPQWNKPSVSKYVCDKCATTFSDEIERIRLAAEAVDSAHVTHSACCETGGRIRDTIRINHRKVSGESNV